MITWSVILCFLWTVDLSHGEGCREDCKITLTVKKPNSMPKPPPPCQPYSQECMILECLPCGPDGTGNKVTLKYVKGREKSLCYAYPHFKLFQKFCCTMNSTMEIQNLRCNLAMTDRAHPSRSDDKSGTSGTSGPGVIGGVVGSLIVLLLLAIFIVLLVQMVRKRRNGRTQQEGRRGFHNKDIESTTRIQSTQLPREPRHPYEEPRPYEYAAGIAHDHMYAQLESEELHGIASHNSSHVYEDADKYIRCTSGANPGSKLPGTEAVPEIQCIITPPSEDEYANPDDALTSKGEEESVTHHQTNIEEQSTSESCTTPAEQHRHAGLKQDNTPLKEKDTSGSVEMSEDTCRSSFSSHNKRHITGSRDTNNTNED